MYNKSVGREKPNYLIRRYMSVSKTKKTIYTLQRNNNEDGSVEVYKRAFVNEDELLEFIKNEFIEFNGEEYQPKLKIKGSEVTAVEWGRHHVFNVKKYFLLEGEE